MRFILFILQYENEEQVIVTRVVFYGIIWFQFNFKIFKVEYVFKDEVINYFFFIILCVCFNKKIFFFVKILIIFLMFQLERFQNLNKSLVIIKEVKQDIRKEREEKERAEREVRREVRKKDEEEKKKRRTLFMREWDRDKIRQFQEREEVLYRGRSRLRLFRRGGLRGRDVDTRRDRRGI